MRLGYDLSVARHPMGGTRRYALELLRAVRQQAPDGSSVTALRGLPRIARDGAVSPVIRRPINLALDAAWWAAAMPCAARAHQLDAWFAPVPPAPLLPGRPVAVTVHDLNLFEVGDHYDARYAAWGRAQLRHVVRRADLLVTASEHVRRRLVDGLGAPMDRVVTVPPGVDHLDRIPVAADSGLPRPYALYVGQTEPHKNVGLLLEAWRAGAPADLTLVIAGPSGRATTALERAAAGPSLRGRVVVTGPLPASRLRAAYRDAELFLFPSLAEGFGFPPLEAMRAGVPTAVSERGALPESTGGAALTFDPFDAEALAALVTRLHEDGALRRRVSAAGLEVAGRYRWAEAGRRIWAVLARV